VQHERNELLGRVAVMSLRDGELENIRGAFDEAQRTITALYVEIGRLQSTLDTIYGSRTWKLH